MQISLNFELATSIQQELSGLIFKELQFSFEVSYFVIVELGSILLQIDWLEFFLFLNHSVVDFGQLICRSHDRIFVSPSRFHSSKVIAKPVLTSLQGVSCTFERLTGWIRPPSRDFAAQLLTS